MQAFDLIREPKNVKRYNTARNTIMSGNSISEDNPAINSHETNEIEGPEICVSTQEEVNEQIKSSITYLTRQLEDLTRIIQGMTTASHPKYYQRKYQPGQIPTQGIARRRDISPIVYKSNFLQCKMFRGKQFFRGKEGREEVY